MIKNRYKLIPAICIFFIKGGEVLLLKRANTGYQDGKYSVPAGHIDGGELAKDAAVREAKEETGVIIKPENLEFVHLSHRLNGSPDNERLDIFFKTEEWEGNPTNLEPNKCDDLSWFPLDDLPIDIIPHVKLVLENSMKGERYSEYAEEP